MAEHAPAGTSACPNGRFYCHNKGYKARWLGASFVDDGICDCCDGSDEARGCNNICAVVGQHETKQLRSKLASQEMGLAARSKMERDGQALKVKWKAEAEAAASNIEALKPVVLELQGASRCGACMTAQHNRCCRASRELPHAQANALAPRMTGVRMCSIILMSVRSYTIAQTCEC